MSLEVRDHEGSSEESNLSSAMSSRHGMLASSLSPHANHPLAQMDTFVIVPMGKTAFLPWNVEIPQILNYT